MIWAQVRRARPGRQAVHILLALLLLAGMADWIGPVLAGGVGAPLLRLAIGQDPSPAAGAAEAGLVGSAIWLAFEA